MVASSDRCASTELSHHQQRGSFALQFGIWRDDTWPTVQTNLNWIGVVSMTTGQAFSLGDELFQ